MIYIFLSIFGFRILVWFVDRLFLFMSMFCGVDGIFLIIVYRDVYRSIEKINNFIVVIIIIIFLFLLFVELLCALFIDVRGEFYFS